MFDLSAKREAWITVRFPAVVSAGDEDGGKVEHEVRLKVEFVDKTEFSALLVGPGDDATDEERAAWALSRDELAIAKRLIVDWAVKDGGVSAPFTDDNLTRLLEWPNFGNGFVSAYSLAYAGLAEEREKNSQGSPSNGSAATTGSARTTTSRPKRARSGSTRR